MYLNENITRSLTLLYTWLFVFVWDVGQSLIITFFTWELNSEVLFYNVYFNNALVVKTKTEKSTKAGLCAISFFKPAYFQYFS